MTRRYIPLLVAVLVLLLSVAWLALRPGSRVGGGGADLNAPRPEDWPMFRRSYDGWGYSPLDQVNKSNVANLQFVWSAPIAPGPLESAPIAVDGVIYLAQPNDIIQAINGKTGDLIWQYRRELPDDVDEVKFPVQPASRNLAFYQDRVYIATSDAYVMALEAKTGKIAWETQAGDYLETTHAAGPIVVGGKVITGRVCKSGPCYIMAHDARTGAELWRRSLADEASWGDTPAQQRGTAGAWMVASYDPELNLLYMGTSVPLAQTRGKALYTNSTLALKPETGEIAWSFQHLPGDPWGLDHVFERIVVSTEVSPDAGAVKWISPKLKAGEIRKVVTGIPGKSGLVWTLDAKTGEFLWARQTVNQNIYAALNPETGEPTLNPAALPGAGQVAEVCPSRLGGKNWTSLAYSPLSKAFYAPLYATCMTAGSVPKAAPGSKLGLLEAISVATGKTLWRYEQPVPLGSVLTTGGGLIFAGDLNRRFRAFDQETGKVLWETVLAGPMTGYPISYGVEGKQYIAVPGGGGTELEALLALVPGLNPLPGVNSIYVFSLPSE